jgi:ABC-type antimicrobial peptide transport system permease subunit
MASVRAAVAALDEDLLPSLSLLTIEEGPLRLQKSLAQTYTMYAGMLALLTLTLAGVGIYGVMAYLVSQRVAEIGIHMALGATPAGVLKAVVVQGLQPVLAGLVLGLAGASALSWTLHTMLVFPGSADFFYGVPFYDPATFLGLSCFLVLVAVIASLVPARHALQVDPMVALRYQ